MEQPPLDEVYIDRMVKRRLVKPCLKAETEGICAHRDAPVTCRSPELSQTLRHLQDHPRYSLSLYTVSHLVCFSLFPPSLFCLLSN